MAFYPKQYGEEPDSEQMTLGQVKQCCLDYEMMDKRADVPAATRELLRPLQKVAQQDRYKKYTMKMWQEVVGGQIPDDVGDDFREALNGQLAEMVQASLMDCKGPYIDPDGLAHTLEEVCQAGIDLQRNRKHLTESQVNSFG